MANPIQIASANRSRGSDLRETSGIETKINRKTDTRKQGMKKYSYGLYGKLTKGGEKAICEDWLMTPEFLGLVWFSILSCDWSVVSTGSYLLTNHKSRTHVLINYFVKKSIMRVDKEMLKPGPH